MKASKEENLNEQRMMKMRIMIRADEKLLGI